MSSRFVREENWWRLPGLVPEYPTSPVLVPRPLHDFRPLHVNFIHDLNRPLLSHKASHRNTPTSPTRYPILDPFIFGHRVQRPTNRTNTHSPYPPLFIRCSRDDVYIYPTYVNSCKTCIPASGKATMSSRGGYERLPMYASVARQRSSSHHPGVTFTPPPSPRPSLRSRHDNHPKPHFFCRPRSIFLFLKFAVPTTILLVLFGFFVYEPHIELAFYERKWIKQEIEQLAPLAGCFDPDKVSPKYNLSDGVYGKRTTSVQAGMPLRMGMDCYDFAGTIKKDTAQETPRRIPPEDRVQYHTYWRVDLAPFGPRQEWMLKSYFATQDISTTRLTLWSNGDLSSNEILQKYLRRYPDSFKLDVVNIPTLAQGTELQDSPLLDRKDAKAWVDGDLIRLLLLWNFGGVWIDMDSLLTRDLEPLLEHEFVTQWDCYGASSKPHLFILIPHRLPR
ncbi:hypothetical protein EYR38_002233 [Pleurotus pulmonarius]|nr:hypothetical protein EYR38_002233 [Pleurotus pulmonarius]